MHPDDRKGKLMIEDRGNGQTVLQYIVGR